MLNINEKLYDKVFNGESQERKYICEKDFRYFFIYYMNDYIKYPFAQFHEDIFRYLENLNKYLEPHFLREVGIVAYRESAKTSIAKAYLLWSIIFKKHPYIIVDSYEKSNSETILFDTIVQLQTNQRIVDDYGQLYNVKETRGEFKETTQKRISNFVTTNGIRVEAVSTQESLRGRLHKFNRISLIIADDFENNKTKDSEKVTQKIIEHFQEALAGMDANGAVIYLGNYITEKGSIQWLMNRSLTDKKMKVLNIPIIKDGTPTWPGKYALTTEEAKQENKISIEELEKKLGSQTFQIEMMNNPYASNSQLFKKEWFQYRDLEYVKANCKKCYITIDTATGAGKDYNGIVVNFIGQTDDWNIVSFRNKQNAGELVNNLFGLYHTYKPVSIGIEKTTYTQGFMNFLQLEMRKRQTFLPIIELKHGGKKKEERIKNVLEPRYSNLSIFHVKGHNTELEDELLKFPLGLTDDVLDALAYQDQVVKGQSSVKMTYTPVYS